MLCSRARALFEGRGLGCSSTKRGSTFVRDAELCLLALEVLLEVDFQRKLERSWIIRGGRLPTRAGCHCRARERRRRIAYWIHIAHVEPVEHVESVSNHLKIYAFIDRNHSRDSKIDLEKARPRKCVPPQRPGAARERNRVGEGKRHSIAIDATVRRRESESLNERRHRGPWRRSRSLNERWPPSRRAEVEVGVFAQQQIVRTPGRDFDNRGDRKPCQKFLPKS